MYAVIMAGGAGTRLWPMSRKNKPKQFQRFITDKTLLEETYDRLLKVTEGHNIYVSTVTEFKEQIQHLLPDIPDDHYFLEPEPKNTGPSLALIASYFAAKDPQAIVGTFASDHVVRNIESFSNAIRVADNAIRVHPDHLMVIGINPTFPDTGKGYIHMNGLFATEGETQIFKVKRFIEKPDLKTAEKFLASWLYLWNASYFVWNAKQMMQWFREFEPKIYEGINKIAKARGTKKEREILLSEYKALPSIAVEYAIAERVKKVLVIPADLGWSDVGAWDTLHDILKEMTGHHTIVKGHHVGHGDEDILVFAHEKMIATVGLKDVIIVDTPDVLLIANKSKAQDVRQLIEKLKTEGKHLYL